MNASSHNFDSCYTHTTIHTEHESIICASLSLSTAGLRERQRRLYIDAVIVTFVILISIQPQIQNSLQPIFLLLACLLAFSSLLFSSHLSLYLPLSISIHVVSIPILQKTLQKTLQTTLSIVSSVHHLTSSAIPHIFNVVERWLTNQNPSPSSSGIKQTGMPCQSLCLYCSFSVVRTRSSSNWFYSLSYRQRTSFMFHVEQQTSSIGRRWKYTTRIFKASKGTTHAHERGKKKE